MRRSIALVGLTWNRKLDYGSDMVMDSTIWTFHDIDVGLVKMMLFTFKLNCLSHCRCVDDLHNKFRFFLDL